MSFARGIGRIYLIRHPARSLTWTWQIVLEWQPFRIRFDRQPFILREEHRRRNATWH